MIEAFGLLRFLRPAMLAGAGATWRPIDDASRKHWRDQALTWFEADIRARRAEVDDGSRFFPNRPEKCVQRVFNV